MGVFVIEIILRLFGLLLLLLMLLLLDRVRGKEGRRSHADVTCKMLLEAVYFPLNIIRLLDKPESYAITIEGFTLPTYTKLQYY